MPKIIRISAEFMRKYPDLLAGLTPMEQKLWFAPFLGVYNVSDEVVSDSRGFVFGIPLHEIRTFLGTTLSDAELRRFIRNSFTRFTKLYNDYYKSPFFLHDIKRNMVYFKVRNFYDFTYIGDRKQFFTFDLDEIASYKIAKKKKTTPIPLLWYLLSHKHKDKENNCWEVNLSDRQLKGLLGLNKYDYLYLPAEERDMFIELDSFYMDSSREMKLNERIEYEDMLFDKYGEKLGIEIKGYLAYKHGELLEKAKFKRWDFEEKALRPILNEINAGHMISLVPQEVYVRGAKGEKASKAKSYIGKNYEFYADGKAAITADGSVITKNITNFRKLETGKQYTFKFKVKDLLRKYNVEEITEDELKFETRYFSDYQLERMNEANNLEEADIYTYDCYDLTDEEMAYWDAVDSQEYMEEMIDPTSWD